MKATFTIIAILFFTINCFATHNRAGEITYKQISGYTFEITVTTFTNRKPTQDGMPPADRPKLEILWGDDRSETIDRSSILELPDYYRKNTYIAQHTYPGPGTYKIVVEDPNRNEGVENIPGSVNVVFSINTYLRISSQLGTNNTPILLNPPIDKAAVNRRFVHNPAAFDPDGDSISYKLTVCTGENGEPIQGYKLPESSNKDIYIDEITGDLVWDSPVLEGIYNIAFFISEYRQGVKIGQITRDMQIDVSETDNLPPEINNLGNICATVGDSIKLNFTATDTDGQRIAIYATGGVFEVDESAKFDTASGYNSVSSSFTWVPKCNHIQKSPHQLVVKASDLNNEVNLVDQKTTYITVNGNGPTNLTASATTNSIDLNWDNYECPNAIGYNIYRSTTEFNFNPDDCETGVPIYTGYKLINTIEDLSATSFTDDNNNLGLSQGFSYCYMITAIFNDDLESKASDEICIELERGIPIITNVSVTEHSMLNGEINIAWSKPIELDTIEHQGPFFYVINRSEGLWNDNFIPIDTLYSLNDTSYTDTRLNTIDSPYEYRIEIHNSEGLTEFPNTASSIFPQLSVADNKININIEKNVPWKNDSYTIYRQNHETLNFDSIGISYTEQYTDNNLANHFEYCYQIKSIGHYDLPGIIGNLENLSHRNCDIPIDTIAPNKLQLNVNSDCNTLINTLTWLPLNNETDIIKYNIYYKPTLDSQFEILDSIMNPDSLEYMHKLIEFPSGCYSITATDSALNESSLATTVCVDACSVYELPNVFSPNGDLINDVYSPLTDDEIINNFIESVDFRVYSRWGVQVFETTDAQIKWDGKHYKTNKLVSAGVYYYVCSVFEKHISGTEERNIVGFIHVFY